MRLAWSSVAALAIAPLQDLLNLGRETRMNVPGRPDGNWRWRCTEDMLSSPAFQWLQELTERSKRAAFSGGSANERHDRNNIVSSKGLPRKWLFENRPLCSRQALAR